MSDSKNLAAAYESGKVLMAHITGFPLEHISLNKEFNLPGNSQIEPSEGLEKLFQAINSSKPSSDESLIKTGQNYILVLISGACSKAVLLTDAEKEFEIEIAGKDFSVIKLISEFLSKNFDFNEDQFINDSLRMVVSKFSESNTKALLSDIYEEILENPFIDTSDNIIAILNKYGLQVSKPQKKAKVSMNISEDRSSKSPEDIAIKSKGQLISYLRKVNPDLSELELLNHATEIAAIMNQSSD